MKIARIELFNFQGLPQFLLELRSPINIIAGPNGAGKSTVREAIELALTGVPRRVELKQDLGKLVHDAAKSGRVAVFFEEGGIASYSIPSGEWIPPPGIDDPSQLRTALDSQRFASLKPDERRSFLFAAARVPMKPDEIKARLLRMGLDPERVEQTAPLLRSGFEAAHKEAAGMARDAKAAWRAVTGEQWGANKSADWRPASPPWGEADDVALMTVVDELAALQRERDARVQAIADWEAGRREYERAAGQRAALKARADTLPLARENAERAARELEAQREKVAELRAKAGTPGAPPLVCPHCGGHVVARGAVLLAADAPSGDDEARGALPEHEAAEAMLTRALASRQQILGGAEAAAAELAVFALPNAPGDPPASTAALDAKRRELESQRLEQSTAKANASAIAAKAQDAAKHDADVRAWLAIASAVAPDGLPAKLLAEALGPLNERAAWAARVAKWPAVTVHADMTVTRQLDDGRQREYPLLSESEKWRADACLAVAFAAIMGTGIVLLDRWDVLEVGARGQALAMLRAARVPFGIEAAFLFGTLKAPPAGPLPSGVAAHWLGNAP